MRRFFQLLIGLGLCGLASSSAAQICPPRPAPGSQITNPLNLSSKNGVLSVDLALKSQPNNQGTTHYCYVYMYNNTPIEAPTLRLNPGDQLILNLSNDITKQSESQQKLKSRHALMEPMEMGDAHAAMTQGDPCLGGIVDATSTNLHFHGLNIAPVCHQDEVVKTIIPNNGKPFQYSIKIPANDPPGLYWYHPHPHGFSAPQVNGGAAGALIIEGDNPLTHGLTERVMVVRMNPDSVSEDQGALTLNFVPASYPRLPKGIIRMQSGKKEFWRVLNASINNFLTLRLYYDVLQQMQVISLDGIPLKTPTFTDKIVLPPAGRVEFIVPPLAANGRGTFWNDGYNTGTVGDHNGAIPLADIVASNSNEMVIRPEEKPAPAPAPIEAQRFSGLESVSPGTVRRLYFSERVVGSKGPTQFFVTIDGKQPKLFDANNPPDIVTSVGQVEDWTIENRSAEPHAFHIHQIHFLLTAINGQNLANPTLQDTVTIPFWNGTGPYPSVTVRMDFRDPNIAGKFVYHCHILDHEDGGMMATIVVTGNHPN